MWYILSTHIIKDFYIFNIFSLSAIFYLNLDPTLCQLYMYKKLVLYVCNIYTCNCRLFKNGCLFLDFLFLLLLYSFFCSHQSANQPFLVYTKRRHYLVVYRPPHSCNHCVSVVCVFFFG